MDITTLAGVEESKYNAVTLNLISIREQRAKYIKLQNENLQEILAEIYIHANNRRIK